MLLLCPVAITVVHLYTCVQVSSCKPGKKNDNEQPTEGEHIKIHTDNLSIFVTYVACVSQGLCII